jgi:hypothetical protein
MPLAMIRAPAMIRMLATIRSLAILAVWIAPAQHRLRTALARRAVANVEREKEGMGNLGSRNEAGRGRPKKA